MSGDKRDHRGPVVDPAGGRAPGGPPRGIGGPRGGGGGAGDGGPRWRSAQAAGPAAWVMSGLGAGGRPLAKVPSFEDLMPAELRQNRASRAQQKNEAMARSAQAGPTGSSQAGGRAGAAQPGVSRQGMGAGLPHWQQSEQTAWSFHSTKCQPSPQIPTPFAAGPTMQSQAQISEWRKAVDVWFQEAADKDGWVKGASAVHFFRRTGLDDGSLAKVWERSVPPFNQGMTHQQFESALKLVALLQSGQKLTIQSASAAVAVPTPAIFPRIAPAAAADPETSKEDMTKLQVSPSSSSSGSDMPLSTTGSVPAPPWLVSELVPSSGAQDSLQLFSHPDVDEEGGILPSGQVDSQGDVGEEMNGDFGEDVIAKDTFIPATAPLVHVELRLPPLHPKSSAKLERIAAAKGSLIAYPSMSGGMLQWVGVRESLGHLKQGRRVHTEDPDSAPCVEISCEKDTKVTSHTLDITSNFLWLGHENGTVSLWHVDGKAQEMSAHITSWKAHKHGSVSAMVATQWGELWTGSSKGSLRVWGHATSGIGPSEPSRSLHRSHGDKPHGDVKFIVLSSCGSIVWTAGHSNLGLWDAFNGTFLGRIDTDKMDGFSSAVAFEDKELIDPNKGLAGRAQLAARSSVDSVEQPLEAGKKIIGGTVGHITRFIGKMGKKAGNQVFMRMPAVAVAQMNIMRAGTIQALVGLPGEAGDEGSIWVGYKSGIVEQYSETGRILGHRLYSQPVTCLCVVGDRVWAALKDGSIVVLLSDIKREMHKWPAHESRVCSMVAMGSVVYTLGAAGAIKCWSREIPNPMLETEAWKMWKASMPDIISQNSARVLCATWNVNETRPEKASLRSWLGGRDKADKADIIVVGLQEVEMGTGSVARTVAIDFISKSALQEKGNSNAQWWANEVLDALGSEQQEEGSWSKVGMRQMSGIIVIVFARTKLMPYLGNVATASVATGVGGFGGNKGAVAVACTLYRRRLVALSSHFAAHQEAVRKRNANYRDIVKNISFYKGIVEQGPPGHSQAKPAAQDTPSEGVAGPNTTQDIDDEPAVSMGYQRAECVVWVGDFNYRLEEDSRAVAVKKIQQAMEQGSDYRELLANDQCRREMKRGKVFHGLREGCICFQPTYKFDKNKGDRLAYDSSDKQRVPAWTDRIFFRGSKPFEGIDEDIEEDGHRSEGRNERKGALESREPDQICIRSEKYDSCMDVNDSDHKPVWCLLAVDFPVYQQEKKRVQCFKILKQTAGQHVQVPVSVGCSSFHMEHGDVQQLEVDNDGDCACLLTVAARDSPHVIPVWLEVKPLRMFVPARQRGTLQLTARHTEGSAHQTLSSVLLVQAEALFCGWGSSCSHQRFKVHLGRRKLPRDHSLPLGEHYSAPL